MPLSAGTRSKNCTSASSPPAEAPMPTMGKERPAPRPPSEGRRVADPVPPRAEGLLAGLAETGFFMVGSRCGHIGAAFGSGPANSMMAGLSSPPPGAQLTFSRTRYIGEIRHGKAEHSGEEEDPGRQV